jgi:hypothetical protein
MEDPGMATIDAMGTLNSGWGICGFTSSLYALYQNNPTQQLKLAQGGRTATMMLAEIKTYLKMLQADEQTNTLQSIQAFTRTFGPDFASFTIEGYIDEINKVGKTGVADTRDSKYGIAMPPDAVVDYLKRVCSFNAARLVDLSSPSTELVIGVSKPGRPAGTYKGLAHYMYSLNGKIYSWGNQYSSIAAADKDFSLCYKISIHG